MKNGHKRLPFYKTHPLARDSIIVLSLMMLTFVLIFRFNIHEKFNSWLNNGGSRFMREANELLLVAAISSLFFLAFALLRIRETAASNRELKKHRSHLEAMVMERSHALAESHRQIEYILGATKTGLDIIDEDYNLVYIDPSWGKLYGDHKGRKCYEYFMGREEVCPNCGVARALATKKPVVTEEVLTREGNRPIQVSTIPYQDKKGRWLVAEVNVDMTAQKRLEGALRESRDMACAILEHSFQFIGLLDPKGILLQANKAALEFAGVDTTYVIGKPFWEGPWWSHSPELQKTLRSGINSAAQGEFIRFEATHPDKNGELHYIDFSLKPVKDKSGKVIYIVPEGRDITDRKKFEDELDAYKNRLEELVKQKTGELISSEARFRTIFNDSRDGMILADIASKRFVMCNNAICGMLGYPESELLRLGVSDIHPEADRQRITEIFEEQGRGDLGMVEELPMMRKDGSIFYADINVSRIELEGKKYLLGSFHDITERKEAKEALDQSENNYRSIFELANDAIIVRDIEDYSITDANAKACEIFCYSKEEMGGLSFGSLSVMSETLTEEKLKEYYDKASAGEPQMFEWLSRDKFGREFWTDVNIKRAVIAGRSCILSIMRDITERKRASEMKDNFTNMVSHELRTPLATIKESISLVSEGDMGPVTKEQNDIFSIIKRNVDRLARLINQVLDLQKIEAGAMRFDHKEYDINKVVDDACRAMLSLAGKKGLRLICKPGPGTLTVKFDKDRIGEVLINLIDNAIKNTEDGTITVATALDGNYVDVSVKDTGRGIRREDMTKLFQRFWQSERKAGGTGLGLSICKEIVESHRGTIWAESEFGKGATFHFTIPLER